MFAYSDFSTVLKKRFAAFDLAKFMISISITDWEKTLYHSKLPINNCTI